jgi:hypothetical protein
MEESERGEAVSVKPTYVCDVCGAIRKDADHWFLAWSIANGRMTLAPWDVPQSPGHRNQPHTKHLCGRECLHSIIGKWVEESKRGRSCEEKNQH